MHLLRPIPGQNPDYDVLSYTAQSVSARHAARKEIRRNDLLYRTLMKQLMEEMCPNREKHTKQPDSLDHDYLAWHDWAKKMGRTHKQIQCSGCGLWVIWIPKGASTLTPAQSQVSDNKGGGAS